eukprot:COSAG01_NODE_503_length_16167_cov_10.407230_18_plen_80_part_00
MCVTFIFNAEAHTTAEACVAWRGLPAVSVGPADLQTVFDPKAAMAAFEILRLQPPRGAQLVRWEEQFRVCRADRPNRAH